MVSPPTTQKGFSGRYNDVNGYFDFKPDGTVFGKDRGNTSTGTYRIDGDEITITWATGAAYRAKIEGDVLVGMDGAHMKKQ